MTWGNKKFDQVHQEVSYKWSVLPYKNKFCLHLQHQQEEEEETDAM